MKHYDEWSNGIRPKIPEGKYLVYCIEAFYGVVMFRGKPLKKALLTFNIIKGDYKDTHLPMFLRLPWDDPRPQYLSEGTVPRASKYFTSWMLANELVHPARLRLQEMAVARFVNKLFCGYVTDTKSKYEMDDEKPTELQYSKINELIRLVTNAREAATCVNTPMG